MQYKQGDTIALGKNKELVGIVLEQVSRQDTRMANQNCSYYCPVFNCIQSGFSMSTDILSEPGFCFYKILVGNKKYYMHAGGEYGFSG